MSYQAFIPKQKRCDALPVKGTQLIILVLARGLKKRLLIVTPFDEKVKRITSEIANQRNHLMAELSDEIFVAYALPGGSIEKLITDISAIGKTISSFKNG